MFRYLVGPGFDFGLPRAQWDSTMSPNPVGNTGVLQFSGVSQPFFLGPPTDQASINKLTWPWVLREFLAPRRKTRLLLGARNKNPQKDEALGKTWFLGTQFEICSTQFDKPLEILSWLDGLRRWISLWSWPCKKSSAVVVFTAGIVFC